MFKISDAIMQSIQLFLQTNKLQLADGRMGDNIHAITCATCQLTCKGSCRNTCAACGKGKR